MIEAWYPGEEGGTAIAETLAGDNNPAGRLPVTFYASDDQLPPFDEYAMSDRTYRYFRGTPRYGFGFGLSYSTFRYRDLVMPTGPVRTSDSLIVAVNVTNLGKRAGDEVVQLYLSQPTERSDAVAYAGRVREGASRAGRNEARDIACGVEDAGRGKRKGRTGHCTRHVRCVRWRRAAGQQRGARFIHDARRTGRAAALSPRVSRAG